MTSLNCKDTFPYWQFILSEEKLFDIRFVFGDKLDTFSGNRSAETKVSVTSVTPLCSVMIW